MKYGPVDGSFGCGSQILAVRSPVRIEAERDALHAPEALDEQRAPDEQNERQRAFRDDERRADERDATPRRRSRRVA